MTSTQQIVSDSKTRLENALPDLVSAAGLAAIKTFLDYDPTAPNIPQTPIVWLDVPDDQESADSRRGASFNKYSRIVQLYVGVIVAGPDESAVAGSLRGYCDLVRKCLEGDQSAITGALWTLWRRARYSGMFKDNMALVKGAIITFDVNRRSQLGGD